MTAMLVRSVAMVLGVSVGSVAQQSWIQLSFSGPAARTYHAVAYDSQRAKTVLFGGHTLAYQGWLADTWEWDGSSWSQSATAGPPARWLHAMAYDSQRGRVVLFGGTGVGANLQDTWEWNGATWTLRATTGPSPRYDHAMAYDSQRGRTVLFGGSYAPVGGMGDTWEWDGTAWLPQLSASGPPARQSHALVYDSQRGRTVMFGGNSSSTGFLGDTWEWNGSQWAQVSNIGPSPRGDHAMAYDSHRGKTVVFGGRQNGGVIFYDTWEWDGTAWTNVANTGPSPRWECEMAYDSQRWTVVLFGGNAVNGVQGDTWGRGLFLPSAATPFGLGCGTPPLSLAGDSTAPPRINTTARASLISVPSPVAFVALGLSNTTFGPFTLPVTLAGIGMPGCNLLQSAEVVGEGTTATGAGTATYSFAIPNNPALVGFHVYLQGWAWAPGANAANIIVSNGLDWQIGY